MLAVLLHLVLFTPVIMRAGAGLIRRLLSLLSLLDDLVFIGDTRILHLLVDLFEGLGVLSEFGDYVDVAQGQFLLEISLFVFLQLEGAFAVQAFDVVDGILGLGVAGLGGFFAKLDGFDFDLKLFLESSVAAHEELVEDIWELNFHFIYIFDQKHEELTVNESLDCELSCQVSFKSSLNVNLSSNDFLIKD